MKAIIKFAGVTNIDVLIRNAAVLDDVLKSKIEAMQLDGLRDYLDVLINNPEFNQVAVEYDVVKHLNQHDTITFSNYQDDWFLDGKPVYEWFLPPADNLNFYTLDVLCEISSKGLIGNYFVLSLAVIDVGYIISGRR